MSQADQGRWHLLPASLRVCLHWVCGICKRWDLREVDPLEERAFKATLEHSIVIPLLVTMVVGTIFILRNALNHLGEECEREDGRYEWDMFDVRTVYFSANMLAGIVCALFALTCTVKLAAGRTASRFLRGKWEAMAVFAVSFGLLIRPLISAAGVAVLFGRQPQDVWVRDHGGADLNAVITNLGFITAVCIYMPIRGCILWVVPFCISLSHIWLSLFARVPTSSFHVQAQVVMFFVFFCLLEGARRNEINVREKWHTVRKAEGDLKEMSIVTDAFRTVANALCEVVIMLDQELRVTEADLRLYSFLGCSVHHRLLSDLIAAEDKARYHRVLQAASESHTIQSVPISLELEFAIAKVQMIVVDTGVQYPRYLIGLHSVERLYRAGGQHSEDLPSIVAASQREDYNASFPGERLPLESVHSMATTTRTGQVFAELSRMCIRDEAMKEHLQKIAAIGVREHWLVSTADVEFLPSFFFGQGGYGLVMGARVMGQPVAAKLPRQAVKIDSTRFVSSLANELRIFRQVRHPNIVSFIGACIDPDHFDIVLFFEPVDGVRLDDFVSRHIEAHRSELQRLSLLLGVSSALSYLHYTDPPIVHGDLKPSNILVEDGLKAPRPKLLDFGLSRVLTRTAKPLGGTRGWIAPELLSATIDRPAPSADVFSFGLIAKFVSTGQRPSTTVQSAAGVGSAGGATALEGTAVHQSEFSTTCHKIHYTCTLKDPQERPEMDNVHNCFLAAVRKSNEETVGQSAMMLAASGTEWRDGRKIMEELLETKHPFPRKAGAGQPGSCGHAHAKKGLAL